ncbi:serine hydrolase domain-containing protein [Microbulbifer sp. TYP-18]|uniref:serine hydrolase domain-containing protein n=1 Tax=Microbulbifer sp. TYP-18 TaxID=3230024 RepID=UPI0034C6473E
MDRRNFSKLVVGAATSCALSQILLVRNAFAANDKEEVDEFRRLVRYRILQQHAAYAAVAGTINSSGRCIITVRDPNAGDGYRLGGDTIFEIASLTKVFTALLLALEVVQKRVRLDDPLQKYVPDGIKTPTFEGRQITLADLATHSASLPLRPNNLATSAPDALNKYAGYTLKQLYGGLPDYHLTREPGAQFEYSNLAFALLGQGIALREDSSFAELLHRRVVEPLGLKDTAFEDDPREAGRRAQGHDFYLDPVGPTSDGALSPAGGLRSTAKDLLSLLDLFINGRGPKDLVAAARLILSVDRPGDDEVTRMALGWRKTTIHGQTYYWSNGSSDGSRTFMGFNLARGLGVVTLADAASGGGLDDISRRFLDPRQEVFTQIFPEPVFVTLPEGVLLRAVGRYEYGSNSVLEISRGATGLIVTAGKAQFGIRPQSPTLYSSKMVPGVSMEFKGAEVGPAHALVVLQNGESYVHKRKE